MSGRILTGSKRKKRGKKERRKKRRKEKEGEKVESRSMSAKEPDTFLIRV